jgi:hypothetical protein
MMRRVFALALLALVGVGVMAVTAVACPEHTAYNGS